jgi:hypothetical protein
LFLFLGLILQIIAVNQSLNQKPSPGTAPTPENDLKNLKMGDDRQQLKTRQSQQLAADVIAAKTALDKGDLRKLAAVCSKRTPEQIQQIAQAYEKKTGNKLADDIKKSVDQDVSRLRKERKVTKANFNSAISDLQSANKEMSEISFTDYLIKKTSFDDTHEMRADLAQKKVDMYGEKNIELAKAQRALGKRGDSVVSQLQSGNYEKMAESLNKLAKAQTAAGKLNRHLTKDQHKEIQAAHNALAKEHAEVIDTLDNRITTLEAVRDGSAVAVTVGATVATAGGASVIAAGGMTAQTAGTAMVVGTAAGTGMRTTQQVAEAAVDENKTVSEVLTAKNIGKNVRQSAVESVSTAVGLGAVSKAAAATNLTKAAAFGSGGVVSEVMTEADTRVFDGQGRDLKTFAKDTAISATSGIVGGKVGEKIAKVGQGIISDVAEGAADLTIGATEEFVKTGDVTLKGTVQNAVTVAPMTAAGRASGQQKVDSQVDVTPKTQPEVRTSSKKTVEAQVDAAPKAKPQGNGTTHPQYSGTIDPSPELVATMNKPDVSAPQKQDVPQALRENGTQPEVRPENQKSTQVAQDAEKSTQPKASPQEKIQASFRKLQDGVKNIDQAVNKAELGDLSKLEATAAKLEKGIATLEARTDGKITAKSQVAIDGLKEKLGSAQAKISTLQELQPVGRQLEALDTTLRLPEDKLKQIGNSELTKILQNIEGAEKHLSTVGQRNQDAPIDTLQKRLAEHKDTVMSLKGEKATAIVKHYERRQDMFESAVNSGELTHLKQTRLKEGYQELVGDLVKLREDGVITDPAEFDRLNAKLEAADYSLFQAEKSFEQRVKSNPASIESDLSTLNDSIDSAATLHDINKIKKSVEFYSKTETLPPSTQEALAATQNKFESAHQGLQKAVQDLHGRAEQSVAKRPGSIDLTEMSPEVSSKVLAHLEKRLPQLAHLPMFKANDGKIAQLHARPTDSIMVVNEKSTELTINSQYATKADWDTLHDAIQSKKDKTGISHSVEVHFDKDQAMTVTLDHELGHIVHNGYSEAQAARWDAIVKEARESGNTKWETAQTYNNSETHSECFALHLNGRSDLLTPQMTEFFNDMLNNK